MTTAAHRLDVDLRGAHAANDARALIALYRDAAQDCTSQAAAFFLTHAYIHALEAGDTRAGPLRAQLVAMGAET